MSGNQNIGGTIGDKNAKTLFCDPEINIYDINENDRYIIIASKTVWEAFSNDEIGKITLPYFNLG